MLRDLTFFSYLIIFIIPEKESTFDNWQKKLKIKKDAY